MASADLKKIILVDDLKVEPILKKLLDVKFGNFEIKRLQTLKDLEDEFKIPAHPTETVVIINAHVRFEESDYRYQLLGTKLIRYELRTRLRRQEPIVVYSPLNRDRFMGIVYHRIFRDYPQHHAFLKIPDDLRKLPDCIEEVQGVEKGNLDDIILNCGSLPALIHNYKHDLENALYLTPEISKVREVCKILSELVPEQFHEEFKITQLLNVSNNLGNNNIEKEVEDIKGIIKDYSSKAKRLLSSSRK